MPQLIRLKVTATASLRGLERYPNLVELELAGPFTDLTPLAGDRFGHGRGNTARHGMGQHGRQLEHGGSVIQDFDPPAFDLLRCASAAIRPSMALALPSALLALISWANCVR